MPARRNQQRCDDRDQKRVVPDTARHRPPDRCNATLTHRRLAKAPLFSGILTGIGQVLPPDRRRKNARTPPQLSAAHRTAIWETSYSNCWFR